MKVNPTRRQERWYVVEMEEIVVEVKEIVVVEAGVEE